MKRILTPRDFGFPAGVLVRIAQNDGSEAHIYPQEYVVIEPRSVLVGDDLGMRVASYPYYSYIWLGPGPCWGFFAQDTPSYVFRPQPFPRRNQEFRSDIPPRK